MIYEIPLSGAPQRFTMSLPYGTTGTVNDYVLTFSYRDAPEDMAGGGGWVLDIADAYGEPLACGLPLVTGADLLAQFEYLNLGGHLIVESAGIPDATPTFNNLGSGSRVYWVTV